MIKHTFEEDLLDRKKEAKKYLEYIQSLNGNFTIALNSSWGTGKTKFLDFMCADLKEANDIYIRYNAWENDFTDDPFLSLMSEFTEQIKKYLPKGEEKLNVIKTTTYQASKRIIPSVIKGATQFFIGQDAVNELENGGKEIISAIVEDNNSSVNDIFNNIEQSKQSRKNFTIEFEKLVNTTLEEHNKKQFVFIIDELDRCKPSFAIELLENIKHLFEVDNVVFLIAVDKIQLSESIKVVYGSNFDSMTYLQRFFDLDLKLSKRNSHLYFQKKLKKMNMGVYKGSELFSYATDNLDLSFRDFERITSEVATISLQLNKEDIYFHYLFTLLVMKYKLPKLYEYLFQNKDKDLRHYLDHLHRIDNKNVFLGFIQQFKDNLFEGSGSLKYLRNEIHKYFDLIN